MNSKASYVNQSLLLIKRFAIQYVVLMSAWILFLIIGAANYLGMFKKAWKEDDHLLFLSVCFDIAFLFAIAAALALVKYIHDTSNNSISSKSKSKSKDDDHNKYFAVETSGKADISDLKATPVDQ